MSRVGARDGGLQLLRAAVADARTEHLSRGARDLLVRCDLVDGGPRPAGRVGGGSGRLAPGTRALPVPSPSPAGDGASGAGADHDRQPADGQDGGQPYDGQAYDGQAYDGQTYDGQTHDGQTYDEPPVEDLSAEDDGLEDPELRELEAPGASGPEGEAARSMALVQRAQQGDADAFGELYDCYVDMVYRYVHHRVASQQLAEDLTSETFLRALRRIGSFTWQGRDVGAWFVTIARNLVADHYKSGRYRLELVTDDVTSSAPTPVQEGPEGTVLTGMQNAVLLDAVRRLGPEQQECIALRFLQGLSVSETARIMGKNDGAIKALQYRAVRALGRLLPEGVEL